MCISILFFFFQQFSRTVLVDQESLEKDILAIDPDIPRTHRELAFNQNEGLMGLMVVRDILITYSAQYPVHGYTQGMTDVASCFYEALDSKAEEFFCFCNYMRRYRVDYMPQGLTKKIESMTLILRKLDPTPTCAPGKGGFTIFQLLSQVSDFFLPLSVGI
ncbi:TBC1 domain family member 25-like [Latimeria chalumnae]|uniref:TBC1 domain family member 25-like n=1 Tax=Latimeria chalumnae TaxID=7897 RepID=UPI00313E35A8